RPTRPRRPPPRPRWAASRRSARPGRGSPRPYGRRRPRRNPRRPPSPPRRPGGAPSPRRCPSPRPSRARSCRRNASSPVTVYGPVAELADILRRRRMHRAFLPEPLPRDQVERIAGVIRRAPSGGFSQGGSIVVVTDEDRRHAIARAFGDEHYSTNGRNFIADAPVHMVVSANEALYHARYTEPDKLQATGGV